MKLKNALMSALLVLTIFTLSACGGSTVDNSTETFTDLKIMTIAKGYGTDWLKAIAKAFEEENQGVKVSIETKSLDSALKTSIESGPSVNDVDIYFNVNGSPVTSLYESYKSKWVGYENGLLDYSDIYNETVPGESVTVREKMVDSVYNALCVTTDSGAVKQFSMPWAIGMMGLMYNKDVLNNIYPDGYTLPQTSNDLITMLNEIKAKGYTGICYPAGLNQLASSLGISFWAQYEGLDGVENFFNGKAYNEDVGEWELSSDVVKQQGILEALKVLEKIANPENGYVYGEVTSYDGSNFRNLQIKFLTTAENIAFYPCGDWLEQESAFDGSSEVGMMKAPVISSIINTLDTISSETELKEVISYVDGDVTTINSKYSKADIERVREARNTYYSNSCLHYAYSPAYTNAPTLVKKFMTFMATDKAIKIYKDNVLGGFLPYEYDYSDMNLTGVSADIEKVLTKANLVSEFGNTRLSIVGELYPVLKGNTSTIDSTIDLALSTGTTSKIRKTAQEIYESGFMTDAEWNNLLSKAGLL